MKRLTTFNQFISSQISFKTLSILLVFFLFHTTIKVHAQIPDTLFTSADTSFFDIKNKLDAFFNSPGYLTSRSSTIEEDGIETNYYRWINNWQSRIDATGNMNIANRAMYEYRLNGTGCNRTNDITFNNKYKWKSLGPDYTDYSTTSAQNQGRIISISANPSNINSILCSGVGGGIWKSDNGGVTWHNVTDDEGFSTFGYSSIKRSPVDPNWIFASSVNGNPGPYALLYESNLPYSGGIIMSTDNGESWSEIQAVNEIPDPPFFGMPGILSLELGSFSTLNIQNYFLRKAHGLVEVIVDRTTGTLVTTVINRPVTSASDPWVPLKYHDLAVGMIGTKEVVVLSRGAELFIAEKDPSLPGPLTFTSITNFQSQIRGIPFNDATFFDDINIFKKIEVDISQGNIVIDVSYGAGTSTHRVIFYSNDKGINWTTNQTAVHTGFNMSDYGFEVSKTNKDIIYINSIVTTFYRGVTKSLDGGSSFVDMPKLSTSPNMHSDVRCISISNSDPTGGGNDIVFYGNDGGLVRTLDGLNWDVINGKGLVLAHYYGVGLNEKNEKEALSGAQDGSEGYLLNGKWSNNFRPGGGDNGECIIDPTDDNYKHTESNYIYYRIPSASVSDGASRYLLMPMELNKGNLDELVIGFRTIFVEENATGSLTGGSIETFTGDNGVYITTLATTINAKKMYFARNIYFNHGWDGAMGNIINPIFRAERLSGGGWNIIPINNSINMGRNPITVPPTEFDAQTSKEDPLYHGIITDMVANPNDNDGNSLWVTFGGFAEGKHVYFTSDAGATWSAVQQNCLPNFPINCIAYQERTNDRIFVGTDVGVFFTDNTMDHWEKYGINYPDIPVLDIEFNYCGNKMVISTYGRGIWEVPLIPNEELATTSYTAPLEFNDGLVHNIYTDIRVNPYSSIIISNGTTLNMAKDKKIIVEQNGVLKVDDGTITNECNSMWEGIIVKGTNNLPQKPFNELPTIPLSDVVIGQGVLILKNATISNAHEAIRLYNPDAPYVSTMISDQTGEAGGIVQAENSSFINNKRSCEFMYYHYFDPITGIEAPNISYFTNCTFTTDDNHRTEYPFANHITMWSVNGVNISSCLFKNDKTATTLTSAELMGQGIYTMDASYTVKYSGFENLTRGLQAIQGGNGSVNVFKTGFKDNLMGLYLIAGINSSIKTNSFESGTMTISPPSYLVPVGAAFLGNSKYGFSNNTFKGTALDIGSWICNSGSDDNLCFSNYYETNTYANLSNYKNRKSDGFLGLQYKCNINKTNIKDFTVYSPGGTSTLGYGIKDNQGSATEYVGNIFSSPPSSDPLAHFDQRDADVKYYVPTFSTAYDPIPSKCSPLPAFNLIRNFANSTCPIKTPPSSSNITGAVISGMAYYNGDDFTKLTATERTNMENSFITNKSNYEYFSNQLKNLIDNGNTPELIESIQASSQAADLRATLLSSSPYLSAEALIAASDQTAVLSEAMIFEILCANPEALNDQALLEYLQTKDVPLPQWMIDVLQNNTNTTARTLMEYAISDAHDKMMVDARAILQDIQFNPEGLNHEEMRFWLGQLHDVEADYSIIDDYIELGNYNDAQIIMNSIPLLYKLDKYQSAEYQTMLDLNNWKLDLFQNGSKSYTTMSENEKSSLQAIADNGFGLGKYKAENILNYFANGTYLHLPELPNNQNQRRANPIKSIVESKEVYIKAYPNPAKDLLIFEFQLPCVEKEALLEIIDITGKKVYEVNVQNEMHQHILDVQKFANGLYSYTLKCGGSIISNGKVSIQK